MLSLRFLGEPSIERDGVVCDLPRSRKTRALLAYLAVTNRSHRRDRLCEMLWEVPDDPRGALRWSLSKIRNLIDEPGHPRIIADRESVAFRREGASIDILDLRAALVRGVQSISTPDLIHWAGQFSGDFLEGLDMPDQHVYHAWCIAEREEARKHHVAILEALVERLRSDPTAALVHARALCDVDSYQEENWARLVRLLAAVGRRQEAEEQCALALRVLEEHGVSPSGPLLKVMRNLRKTAALAATDPFDQGSHSGTSIEVGASSDHSEADETQAAHQEIRYCRTPDGVKIAYALAGQGPPLLKTGNWLTHLKFDWESPVWRHWMRELASQHRLIRYDQRGNGLSDWDTPELSFQAYVRDLETVVDAAGLEKFSLFGLSLGASIAIAYAHRHPERLSNLVIFGGYVRGWKLRDSQIEILRRHALKELIEHGWGQDNPAFRQVFTSRYMPEGTLEQMSWMNELQRMTTTPQIAAHMMDISGDIDVRHLLPDLRVRTLVIHCREDDIAPFSEGEIMAKEIPNAEFLVLEGKNHILLESEPAWDEFVRGFRRFLDETPSSEAATATSLNAWPSTEVQLGTSSERKLNTTLAAEHDKPSIVVLPFRGMSLAGEHEFFAAGITDDLTTTLSRVLGLFVVSRDSALTYKSSLVPASEIARELGVRYALHGIVRTSAGRVRVNAYVVDSLDGREVWSERFDQPAEDVFAVQDQITTKVVRALQVELLEGEQATIWHRSTQSVEAWSLLTEGLIHNKQQTRDAVLRARKLFERATVIDPKYAVAWFWLAYSHWMDARFLWVDEPQGALDRAEAMAERALKLDHDLAEVHSVIGIIRVLRHDFDSAIKEARLAVKISPNSAEATALLAFVLNYAGEPEEAMSLVRRAFSFSPHPAAWFLDTLGRSQRLLRQFPEAIESYEAAILRLPDYIMPRIGICVALVEAGTLNDAKLRARDILRINPKFSIARHTRLNAYRKEEHQARRLLALRAVGLPE